MRPEIYELGEITQRLGLLRHSRWFKVTEFGTNRKLTMQNRREVTINN